MKYKKGNILQAEEDYICFTANSVIKRNGELVMGAGVAKAFRDNFKGISLEFGNKIEHLSEFNLLVIDRIIALQTKIHFKNPSPIDLIDRTISKLNEFALENSNKTIAMTLLGTLNGGLDENMIKSKLNKLPDNITVYEI